MFTIMNFNEIETERNKNLELEIGRNKAIKKIFATEISLITV